MPFLSTGRAAQSLLWSASPRLVEVTRLESSIPTAEAGPVTVGALQGFHRLEELQEHCWPPLQLLSHWLELVRLSLGADGSLHLPALSPSDLHRLLLALNYFHSHGRITSVGQGRGSHELGLSAEFAVFQSYGKVSMG